MSLLSSINDKLFSQTTPGWYLGYARIVTGLTLLYSLFSNRYYYILDVSNFPYTNTYDGFEWIQPIPQAEMRMLVLVGYIIYLLFTLGILYRPISILSALITWYFFFLEKGNYNNHYYLHCLFASLFTLVDAHTLSIDSVFRKKKILHHPFWQLFLFKFQIAVVYFYGGIAKLNVDWLHGYPLRYWLHNYGQTLEEGSFFNQFFCHEYTSLVYSYGGIAFDLAVPVILFLPRIRMWALPVVVMFHISNHFAFNIGSFPWMMLALTLLYFEDIPIIAKWWKRRCKKLKNRERIYDYGKIKRNVLLVFIGTYIAFQVLFPLRQFVFRGHPAWTGQGNWFAWRMMLTDSVDAVSIRIRVPKDNVDMYVDVEHYMNFYQFNKAVRCPMIVLKFIDHLKDNLREHGVLDDAIINLEMYKAINFRPPTLFNDTTLNYAKIDYNPLISQNWIMPYDRNADELKFTEERYEEWREMITERDKRLNELENRTE